MSPYRGSFLTAANRFFAWLERISRHKASICLSFMVLTVVIRIALLPRIPVPQPRVADEFSYLLGAETFASGRLTNPTHPMWQHFETFHELSQPTYMSKYPPGQALFLAAGWRLFGRPWVGVLISFGFFAASACWMLQNWVPPVYALIGTAIALANVSVFGYWMNSYWGGAVSAVGGCLLLGTLPRLARRLKWQDAALAAVGLVLLANTRPYEGLIMSVAAGLALMSWRKLYHRPLAELVSLRCLVPMLLICGMAAVLDGYYNYRVTGSALKMPYTVYSQQYAIASPWLIFHDYKRPVYQNAAIETTSNAQALHVQEIRSNPKIGLTDLYAVFRFYASPILLFPVAIALLLSRSYRLWAAKLSRL